MTEYADLDMNGLRPDMYREVPAEAQQRLIGAFPDMRILWNPVILRFQCVVRDPNSMQAMYGTEGGGVIVGWEIIPGNYERPLNIDEVIRQKRFQQHMATEVCKGAGFDNMSDYADHLAKERIKKEQQLLDDQRNDYFGMNLQTGYIGPNWRGATRIGPASSQSKPFSLVTPRAPAWLDQSVVVASNPSEKRQLDRVLREGAPV